MCRNNDITYFCIEKFLKSDMGFLWVLFYHEIVYHYCVKTTNVKSSLKKVSKTR